VKAGRRHLAATAFLPSKAGRVASMPPHVQQAAVPTGRTVIPARYYGHEHCYYHPGDMNAYCQKIIKNFLQKRNAKKQDKSKLTPVVVTVQHGGIEMKFGDRAEAVVKVPMEDIACMSLATKTKSKLLKLGAIVCRAPTQRMVNELGVGELDLIVHIFKPNKRADVWAFYAAFEHMLRTRHMVDPYLELARSSSNAGAAFTLRGGDIVGVPVGRDQIESTAAEHEALLRFLCPTAEDKAREAYGPRKLSRRDSDISLSWPDSEGEEDEGTAAETDGLSSDVTGGVVVASTSDASPTAGPMDSNEDSSGVSSCDSSSDGAENIADAADAAMDFFDEATAGPKAVDVVEGTDTWEDYSGDGAHQSFAKCGVKALALPASTSLA